VGGVCVSVCCVWGSLERVWWSVCVGGVCVCVLRVEQFGAGLVE